MVTFLDLKTKRLPRRRKCEGCGVHYVVPPDTICEGCEAYREHTGQI